MPFRHYSDGTKVTVATSSYCRQWFTEEGGETTVVSTGAALWQGTPYRDQAFAVCVADLLSRGLPIRKILRELNGQFALIVIGGGTIVAAVDRVRSIPLFYSCSTLPNIVTDDVEEIRCRDKTPALDNIQSEFFLKTGYTLGRATLLEGVSQLLPGEFLTCRGDRIEVQQYYVHFGEEQLRTAGEATFEELDSVSERVFEDTVAILDGRQAVVPLSGGYDSRYILTGLKNNRYENILAFTYGRKNSPEVETARRVVGALNVPWRRIEYSVDRWREFLSSEHFSDFFHRSFQFSSLPCLQEFLAVKELAEFGVLKDDAVFLPGYCGDLLGGSYVPESLSDDASGRSLLETGMVDYSIKRHFLLSNDVELATIETLRKLAGETFATPSLMGLERFVSTTERWFVEHKVSKFVVNAVRTYEHFGFNWYLPLWDSKLLDFWYSVSLADRIGVHRLYNRYLIDHYFSKFHIELPKDKPLGHIVKKRHVEKIFGETLSSLARAAFHYAVRRSRSRDANLFSTAGAEISKRVEKKCKDLRGGDDMNSALARLALCLAKEYLDERRS